MLSTDLYHIECKKYYFRLKRSDTRETLESSGMNEEREKIVIIIWIFLNISLKSFLKESSGCKVENRLE